MLCTVLALLPLGCKGENLVPSEPPPASVPPPPPQETTTVLATATFRDANGYRTVGSARLEEDDGTQILRLDEDFETESSLALDVRLCTRRRCGDNDLPLGTIKSFVGEQAYEVPGDGSDYSFVVIWCTAVDLAFGTGRLR